MGLNAGARPAEPVPTRNAAPEIKLTISGKPTRWHADMVTITLDPSLDELGADAKGAVRAAFGAWIETEASLPTIHFSNETVERGEAKRDGINRVLAGPITLPGHENDLAITISYVDSNGAILEVDMIVNTRYVFDSKQGNACNGYDLPSILTHEAGHFFGLGEDRVNQQSTMYFKTAPCETNKRILSEPDITTVEFLYEIEVDENSVGCMMKTHTGNPWWMVLGVTGLFVLLLRRNERRVLDADAARRSSVPNMSKPRVANMQPKADASRARPWTLHPGK